MEDLMNLLSQMGIPGITLEVTPEQVAPPRKNPEKNRKKQQTKNRERNRMRQPMRQHRGTRRPSEDPEVIDRKEQQHKAERISMHEHRA